MKLSELKTRLKNKYVVRIVAGVLTIALLGSSMTAVAVQADQKKDAAVQTEQKEDSSDKKDDIEDLLQVSVSDKEIGKDENVYLISDATGSVYDTIVTDHLINKNQSATLEDQSNLTDIKNVKGSEEFSQNGEKLTWQADGADIYYQGKTDSEALLCALDTSFSSFYIPHRRHVLSPPVIIPSRQVFFFRFLNSCYQFLFRLLIDHLRLCNLSGNLRISGINKFE